MHEFAVVGCGPAGSRFARRAAEQGYDVVAFERGTVGEPLACSGHVSTDVWEYTPDGARERLRQNVVYGARFHLADPDGRPGGDRPADAGGSSADGAAAVGRGADAPGYPFYKDEQVSNVIDRVGLDRELAEAARDAGADLREDHTVLDVTDADRAIEVGDELGFRPVYHALVRAFTSPYVCLSYDGD
jgi:flavin-dependent dehydrogenase